MELTRLIRNWWMMAARGALAVVFGLVILLGPNVTLSILVVLFAAYVILDGLWAIAAGVRASGWRFEGWPVVLEGLVGIAVGTLALGWPFVSREFIYVVALWGVLTGVLEILAALALPRDPGGHWLLATGGLSSLFLAVLILLLPQAQGGVVALIGIYALVFGVVLSLVALRFRAARARPARLGAPRAVHH